jgi:hypothetical protein
MKIINNFPKLTKLDNIENELTNKAPIDHSSASTTYGTGSSVEYGHVKVSDSYTSSDGTADSGVAASSKAVADAYNEINSNLDTMKPSYTQTSFVGGENIFTLTAGTATKFGIITIPPKCVATIMLSVNNRTHQTDIELGINENELVTNIRWGGTHQKVTEFYSLSDTWIYYNHSDTEFNINVYGKSSINTNLMYVVARVLFTPIV